MNQTNLNEMKIKMIFRNKNIIFCTLTSQLKKLSMRSKCEKTCYINSFHNKNSGLFPRDE